MPFSALPFHIDNNKLVTPKTC